MRRDDLVCWTAFAGIVLAVAVFVSPLTGGLLAGLSALRAWRESA